MRRRIAVAGAADQGLDHLVAVAMTLRLGPDPDADLGLGSGQAVQSQQSQKFPALAQAGDEMQVGAGAGGDQPFFSYLAKCVAIMRRIPCHIARQPFIDTGKRLGRGKGVQADARGFKSVHVLP